MAEPTGGPDEAALAVAARHALHDEELVAALAEDALEESDLTRARGLVERCLVCRDLHADVTAISGVHQATAAMTIAAPRDFRLTAEDAARLRPGVPLLQVRPAQPAAAPAAAAGPAAPVVAPRPLDRVLAAFRTVARPLGGTLVAAGLVGVLVGSVGLGALSTGSPAGAPPVPMSSPGGFAPHAPGGTRDGDSEVAVPTAGSQDLDGETASDDAATPALGAVVLATSLGLLGLGVLLLFAGRGRRPDTG